MLAFPEGYYDNRANWPLIPSHMWDGVNRYVMRGEPVGHFMTAILSNDFMEAVARADDKNLAALQGWAQFIYGYTPSGCHGSPGKVRDWQDRGGILGIQRAAQAKEEARQAETRS